jgi:hypothetical protein
LLEPVGVPVEDPPADGEGRWPILLRDVVLDALSVLVVAASHAAPLISVLGPLLSGPLRS